MRPEKITFNMIIPCHNTSEKYIRRLLDSLLPENQGIEKDQLEIIIVDDYSDDKTYLDICHKDYDNKLNIVYVETDPEKRNGTPSFTRNTGMEYITKDWLCFCDHDDFYEKNALSIFEKHIQEFNTPYAICGNMRSWNEESDKYVDFIHRQAWLHGKCYNIKHLIKPYNIRFYNDIYTHEDIGFNCIVQSILYELNADFDYIDDFIYRWVEESSSITRSYIDKYGRDISRGYLHDNFNDYIIAAARPFFEKAKTGNWWFVNQVVMTLLHCYFYYMGAIFREGEELYEDNLDDIKKFYKKIVEEVEMEPLDIINFVASDERKYQIVRNDCIMHEGCFMEYASFPDFVLYLDQDYREKISGGKNG